MQTLVRSAHYFGQVIWICFLLWKKNIQLKNFQRIFNYQKNIFIVLMPLVSYGLKIWSNYLNFGIIISIFEEKKLRLQNLKIFYKFWIGISGIHSVSYCFLHKNNIFKNIVEMSRLHTLACEKCLQKLYISLLMNHLYNWIIFKYIQ